MYSNCSEDIIASHEWITCGAMPIHSTRRRESVARSEPYNTASNVNIGYTQGSDRTAVEARKGLTNV